MGSTGRPTEWVQIGKTKDHIVQIDANSITGFEGPLGLSHRGDFRLMSQKNERLVTNPKTIFMRQADCDAKGGNLTTFATDPNGQAIGKGETHSFKLGGVKWPDYVGDGLCRARRIVMGSGEALEMLGQYEESRPAPPVIAKEKQDRSVEPPKGVGGVLAQSKPPAVEKKETARAVLNESEKPQFENMKTLAFCAGFLADMFPNNTQSHCSKTGLVNSSNCDAFLVNNWYGDMMNPKFIPRNNFGDFVRQNKTLFMQEADRGRRVSLRRSQFPEDFKQALNQCRNHIDAMKQSLMNRR